MPGKDLVTASHLEPFVQHTGHLQPAERMLQLEKLHYCLELVLMLEQFLSLPSTTLSAAAR